MSHKPHDRCQKLTAALNIEHHVCTELIKALQAQIVINEALREKIAELEKEGA